MRPSPALLGFPPLVLSGLLALAPQGADQPGKGDGGERPGEPVEAGKFSAARPGGSFPEGWEPLAFKGIPRHTRYELVAEGGSTVVRAQSEAAASGLTRKIEVDLRRHPILEWRWKVEGTIPQADLSKKEADDAPARIYVTFAYDPKKVGALERARFAAARLIHGEHPPAAALTYVWASREAVDQVVPSPYTPRSQVIVIRSGGEKLGQWVRERRNLLEDYRKVFGGEPPAVSGIAIMTDTDNTASTATAYYGDLTFKN
jgi:hypothetical protein